MKTTTLFALVALVVASCTDKAGSQKAPEDAPEDAAHTAVTAYLKKNLDDPASYQPARWGVARVWRRGDEAKERQRLILDRLEIQTSALENSMRTTRKLLGRDKDIEEMQREDMASLQKERAEAQTLPVSDTTRMGILLSHAFRAKNKMGGLVLDSAEFLIMPNGQAAPYVHPTK